MKSYPDIKPEHFVALLSLREDTKSGAKKVMLLKIFCLKIITTILFFQKVEESMPDEIHNPQNVHTIFSEIFI